MTNEAMNLEGKHGVLHISLTPPHHHTHTHTLDLGSQEEV